MTCPVKCYMVVTRTKPFSPEKSTGEIHLTRRDAETEKASLDRSLGGCCETTIVPCVIMPEETFFELCPEWKQ